MKKVASNLAVLFDLIGELSRRRYVVGERQFAALGLNHTEARLLTLLDRQGGESTQDALSNQLFIDRSNAGRGLKSLELRGYVERSVDTGDRRANFVHMTELGRKTVAGIEELRSEMARSFFGALTEEQAGTVVNLLSGAMDSEEPRGEER